LSSEPQGLRVALPGWARSAHWAQEPGLGVEASAWPWLRARAARRSTGAAAHWREWLLEGCPPAAALLAQWPAGPALRAATNAAASEATWAVAEPVHLLTAIDHLRLAPPAALALASADQESLLAHLNAQLAGTPFALERSMVDSLWLLRCEEPIEVESTDPDVVVGRNIRDHLPRGRDAGTVRRLMTELQMLLHEHPVNERRARAGEPPVNSLWLWGFGKTRSAAATALMPLATDDAWLASLWRAHGGTTTSIDEAPALIAGRSTSALIAITRAPTSDIERRVLAPLRAALGGARRGGFALLAGEERVELDARSRWRFWRRTRVPA